MNYVEELVSDQVLKTDVLCYWEMSGHIDNAAGISSRYLPKGQNLIVFNYGEEVQYAAPEIPFLNPSFFIVPAIATSKMIHQKGRIDLFGISFIGDGLFKLIQHPISKLTSDLPDHLKEKYEGLHAKMRGMAFAEKIEVTDKFLAKNINQKKNSPPFQQAIKSINESKGIVSISDIAKSVHVSDRQLQRLFKTRIGISPKDYCKIVRVNNYLDFILNKNNPVNWMQLVVEYNYHDQPHLINEVKSIAKLSPKKLISYRDTLYQRYLTE